MMMMRMDGSKTVEGTAPFRAPFFQFALYKDLKHRSSATVSSEPETIDLGVSVSVNNNHKK
ncbi:Dwil\GK19707-PA-like protein [Anopheles sinensis]|uniref:Dwil\GK19707-PA-like protein n=1 Tax=Anopheles sinensis TaxID=74873 RepID=A0A084VC50_ANOSI|nr:Dwil\GK19707-PA-like protein [Anopheles sinensis]